MSPFAEALRTIVRGEVLEREPLSRHTTLRVGGPAGVLAFPEDIEALRCLVRFSREQGLPVYILGYGSNVLAPDEGIRGVVVSLTRATCWARFEGEDVEAGAGYSLPRLVREAARRGLAGLEGLAGVPGSVGGALFMNAGTVGRSIGDVTVSVKVMDGEGETRRLSRDEMAFGYRSSRLQEGELVALSAHLRLEPGNPEKIARTIEAYSKRRRESQPLEYPNAGSIFKNPPGDHAGRLIEAAGCKGMRVGQAQVSERHANFIINLGGATAADVLALMAAVHRRVRERCGVRLEPEVRLLGTSSAELLERMENAVGPPPAGGD